MFSLWPDVICKRCDQKMDDVSGCGSDERFDGTFKCPTCKHETRVLVGDWDK